MGLKRKIGSGLLLFVLVLSAGCGKKSSAPEAQNVILKLSTIGTSSVNLAGVGITLVLPSGTTTLVLPNGSTQSLPSGITPDLNPDGAVAEGVATASGAATPGMVLSPIYTPATAGARGILRIVVVSGSTAGFTVGEFVTVVLKIPTGGNFAQQGSFLLTDFYPVDLSGNAVPGLIASYTVL